MGSSYNFCPEAESWRDQFLELERASRDIFKIEMECDKLFLHLVGVCLDDRRINPVYVAKVICDAQFLLYRAFSARDSRIQLVHLPVAHALKSVVVEMVLRHSKPQAFTALEDVLLYARKGNHWPDHIVPVTRELIEIVRTRMLAASQKSPASS